MKPELLSPAGSYKSMRYAFAYGADAVYAGQPRYSLRVRNNDFSRIERLAEGVDYAHRSGRHLSGDLVPRIVAGRNRGDPRPLPADGT